MRANPTEGPSDELRAAMDAFYRDYCQDIGPNESMTEYAFRRGYQAGHAAGAADMAERCAKACEVYLHNVPSVGGDETDRIGRYSNATVMRCAAACRALKDGG